MIIEPKNAQCVKIVPPGKLKNATLTQYPLKSSSSITFGNESLVLLPPLVKVNIVNGSIAANVIVFMDYSIGQPNFSVSYEFTTCNSGVPQISLYICYDEKIITPYNQYIPYSLAISDLPLSNEQGQTIINLKTFLWDEDPVTSRGTVTTVQPS